MLPGQATAAGLQEVNRQRSERLPRYQERVAKLERYARQSEESSTVRRQELQGTQQQLKHVVRTRAAELLQFIFPIFEMIPTSRR